MSDQYDHMDRDQLIAHLRMRGKPNWSDFPPSTIRELLRDLDYDEQRLAESEYEAED